MLRQAQRHVARIFALAEALPLGVLGGVEDLGQIAGRVELREALQVEQIRSCRAEEGSVRRRPPPARYLSSSSMSSGCLPNS